MTVVGGTVEVTLLVFVMTMKDWDPEGIAGEVLRETVFVRFTELDPWRVGVWVVTTSLDETFAAASMETSICYSIALTKR